VPFQSPDSIAVDWVVQAIKALTPIPGTRTHILVDSWYACRGLWWATLGPGLVITGGLQLNRWLRRPDPLHPGCKRKVRLSAYLEELGAEDFVMVPWPGPLVAAHLVPTLAYKLGACQVLVVKEHPSASLETVRCWATSDLKSEGATLAG
jgi:hypothetical protein